MNILIIGNNTRLDYDFKSISTNRYIVNDTDHPHSRIYKEINDFKIIYSKTRILTVTSIFKRMFEIVEWIKQYDIDIILSNEKNSMISTYMASFFFKRKIIKIGRAHV